MFAWMAPTTGGNATHGWSGPHYILVAERDCCCSQLPALPPFRERLLLQPAVALHPLHSPSPALGLCALSTYCHAVRTEREQPADGQADRPGNAALGQRHRVRRPDGLLGQRREFPCLLPRLCPRRRNRAVPLRCGNRDRAVVSRVGRCSLLWRPFDCPPVLQRTWSARTASAPTASIGRGARRRRTRGG